MVTRQYKGMHSIRGTVYTYRTILLVTNLLDLEVKKRGEVEVIRVNQLYPIMVGN